MPLILNIDTSTEQASICLAEGENKLILLSNPAQKEHATWLHPAIEEALRTCNKKVTDLTAVGITAGPGSYTGLRVAMATAKGLCYALHIPLLTVNTLEAMAYAALTEEAEYLCPAIDARRMEIFTAVYDKSLHAVLAPQNMVVTPDSFAVVPEMYSIVFFGNGSKKMEPVIRHSRAIFKDLQFDASHLAVASYKKYKLGDFTSLSLAEPVYLKEFYTTANSQKSS